MVRRTVGVIAIAMYTIYVSRLCHDKVPICLRRYNECVNKLTIYLKQCGFVRDRDCDFIPLSGFTGDNLKEPVPKKTCPWWSGSSLLQHLNDLPSWERKISAPFIMPITEKSKDMGTMVAGKIESGQISRGCRLLMMPNKRDVEVTAMYFEGTSKVEVKSAQSGDFVKLKVKGIEEEEISTGFVLCDPERPMSVVQRFHARIFIVEHKNIICPGYSAVMHVHTLVVEVAVVKFLWLLDPKTGEKKTPRPKFIKQGQSAIADIKCQGPICIETFENHQQLGRFNLRDEGMYIKFVHIRIQHRCY